MIRFGAIVLAALVFSGAARAQTLAPLSITLSNYAFAPGELDLKVGTTYRLHFVNSASKGHNFSAPEFFAAAEIAAEDQDKVRKGLIELDSGQTIDITITPTRPGTFALECTHFMHSTMGMHGSIVVQQE